MATHYHNNKQLPAMLKRILIQQHIVGVCLFGSWARGDQKENSDIDLLVVQENTTFHRIIDLIGEQSFEIVYNTPQGAVEFWKSNLDNSKRFWDNAVILSDQQNFLKNLQGQMVDIFSKGKQQKSVQTLEHSKFDAYDIIGFLAGNNYDTVSKKMVLYEKIPKLIELYYDIRGWWKPAPKQMVSDLEKCDFALYQLVKLLYETQDFNKHIEVYKLLINHIFEV